MNNPILEFLVEALILADSTEGPPCTRGGVFDITNCIVRTEVRNQARTGKNLQKTREN
jgi:hypothetical protein